VRLDHVLQGARPVVVAGAALEGELLVGDDLDALDVVGVRVEILAATLGAAVVVPDEPAELTEVDLGDATTGGC